MLTEEEIGLLLWRTGFNYNKEDTICAHHLYYYLKYFEQKQKSCCDPYKKHVKPITNFKNLRSVSLQKAQYYKERCGIHVIPGQLLCSNCRKTLSKEKETEQHVSNDESEEEMFGTEMTENDEIELASRLLEKDKLNESLTGINVTPIKLKSISSHSKKSYAKRKLKQVESKIKKKLSYVLKVDETQSDSGSDSERNRKSEEMQKKCNDMDRLVELIKEKLSGNLSKREKIQVLTIAPQSWSRKKIAGEFNVTEYMIRKARKLVEEKGILTLPGPKEGNKILPEVIETVTSFFEDDEYSKMLPGAKDRVSIKKNEYRQKRLLLCNLEELYTAFKQKYQYLKIGFSKFCSLRPKWCVLAGSPGTHAVCVCVIHQNVYLLAAALNLYDKNAVHQLMDKLVCNRESRACMLRCCKNCPRSSEQLKNYLNDILEDYDGDEEIKFSQWVNDDRMKLQSMSQPIHEFVDLMVEKIEALIPHSYIAKTQNAYLKSRKENLAEDEALILMDFAENYSFVLQNEVQSYHWSHSSCSLHPTVIYTRATDGTLRESPLCFISEDLNHDVPFVYCVQHKTSVYIKTNYPSVKKVEYFTAGCSAQYKNFKSMMNLCQHSSDFGIEACWSFHATSHGKTVCDGIGGTVKRTVTKKNLQSALEPNQITNAQQMYMFCCNLFSKISFFFLEEEEIKVARDRLEIRFSKGKTITGTRSFHYFSPTSKDEIIVKRTSMDPTFSLKWNFKKGAVLSSLTPITPSLHSYVACVYENSWWVGLIYKINIEEGDYTILFMHPHGPSDTFYWPQREDKCPVPPQHLLCSIDTPEVTSNLGRYYKLGAECQQKIAASWDLFTESC